MRITLPLLCLVLASCSSIRTFDRDLMTRFAMSGPGQWEMTTTTAANYPIESEKHEAIRLGWIDDHIRANGCSSFEVTERLVTRAPTDNKLRTGGSTNVGTIRYTGTCR